MKAIYKNIFYGALMAATGLTAVSCSDDESNDPYDINYGYLYAPGATEHSIKYLEDGSFLESVDEVEKLVQVRCTRPAPNDLTYTVSIDKSLVGAYNEKNGTDYVLLENARLINSTLTIKKGEYVSGDTLKVTYSDQSEFTNGSKKYLIPVTISSIDGGVTLSENRTFYLTYDSQLLLIEDAESPVGTEITDHTGWNVLLNGTSTTKLTDGNTSNYVAIADGAVLDIDLGKVESFTTIGLQFYAWYYKNSSVSISVSTDGTTYEDLGNIKFAVSKATHYLHSFKAKQVQHIRLTLNGYYYSSDYGSYLKELYIYAAE